MLPGWLGRTSTTRIFFSGSVLLATLRPFKHDARHTLASENGTRRSIWLSPKSVLPQAVVYNPSCNELSTALRTGGAYLKDHRIRSSKRIEPRQSVPGTGLSCKQFPLIDNHL